MTATIDHGSPVPVHQQLASILRERILRGQIEPDQPIPSESDLQERYGLPRQAVRRAVQVLRDEGLVYTIAHRGSYVSSRAEETGGG
ncbi:winged helix-turn-helix domain-containing protein [Planotetraspora sp. A-T 1434]|uniref:winged helix-turn-helix domain-containing protein n=1 Tax=Planotetraspora sp. A-T 1434 TaxID=2979219 RepID=UPI0021C05F61|nr:winged helix-turn-helix domain-containing protein [Planotetraspora sp. A-T 1434]MCT9934258.1 winged helix-turn-helix domain-containing protein [Planotetraspora sp. A-T 1434]